ncbi:hypothetical protein FHR92_004119 [Fontibacillus solani]|uniref:Copper amine oxidase-like N-terminal domain-containing protein n=1 Tax=Fontibacillus solani TaxID=1572857 RepID=A0A7W3XTJ4_9BACL|nr:stalk domain-containing protein [Fontibacillus solani]MBA9087634.1 hypothetical protein [Fontibacillus solani]
MKKLGYVSFGLILGLALSVASPVFAQTVKSITAKINNSVSVVVNGEKVKLNAQPINYNNLNYLPVGEIGRALGMNVSYDKASDSINIFSLSNVSSNTSEGVNNGSNAGSTPTTQEQNATFYYKTSDVQASEFYAYFISYDDEKRAIIRVGGKDGVEYRLKMFGIVLGKDTKEYRSEEFYLQYLTKEQLSRFQKYTYNPKTSETTPVN